jgi:hypothetical protein
MELKIMHSKQHKDKNDKSKTYTAKEKFVVGCKAISGVAVKELAKETNMSRQYIYTQKAAVMRHIDSLEAEPMGRKTIVVTELWRVREILSLALNCHSSIEGIWRHFEDVYGTRISIGYISGVLKKASKNAQEFDESIRLENICQGANDEIFQGDTPVLTGIDPVSTYIYLLAEAGDRTAESWQVFLEDRKDHGLNLKVSISDAGAGLMSGIPRVYPEVEIQPDTFHAMSPIGKEISKLERKAYAQISKEDELIRRSQGQRPQKKTIEQLEQIRSKVQEAVDIYDKLNILFGWLRMLLSFSGYSLEDAVDLMKFVLAEMEIIAKDFPVLMKEIDKFRKNLPALLSFIARLLRALDKSAKEYGIPPEAFRLMYEQLAFATNSETFQEIEYRLVLILMSDYDRAREEFWRILASVKKASGMVENLNGRIRPYMDIKRIVPTGFFVLLKVYFNTRRYRRSRNEDRVGKSPLELLMGTPQPGFFEAIGF